MIEICLHGISAEPQGSGRAMLIGGKARYIATASNASGKRMRSYRTELGREASRVIAASSGQTPYFAKHVPVLIEVAFFFKRPKSVPKSRRLPVVKPDMDKLLRSTHDALTGILYHDDAQVVETVSRKLYADCEGVRICAREVGGQ